MTNVPSAEIVETEERAVEPVYGALLTRLHHCARADPTLKTEIAVYAAFDVALDLSIASGLIWSKRPDIVATLRVLADGLEQRRQNEPMPALIISELRALLCAGRSPAPEARKLVMTTFTRDTPHDICAMLLQGSTPGELLRWEKHGMRIDPDAIMKGVELAAAELRRQAKRDLAHAEQLRRHSHIDEGTMTTIVRLPPIKSVDGDTTEAAVKHRQERRGEEGRQCNDQA